MARIAFAWELGGEYGHAMACAGLARSLNAQGHHIGLMFRELRQLAFLPETTAYELFQAPRSMREGAVPAMPASFAELLLGMGYADPADLCARLGAWRALLSHWRADLLIADFAPTALLAARLLDLKRVTFGNGFFTPPRLSPLPAFRIDEPIAPERLVATDRQALAAANAALARFGAPPLERLSEQFEVEEDFLCTFPELDHYGSRPASGYWGPRFRADRGLELEWPAGGGKCVFVYVKRDLAQLDALLECLARQSNRVIAFIPELEAARRARFAARSRIAAERPVRLDSLLKRCDLLIGHGGEIATAALMHGVPQLSFPMHYEQYLTARRLEQIGSGAWLSPAASEAQIAAAIEGLLAEERFGAAAKAFARRYAAFSPQEQRRRIVARIAQILAAPRSRALPLPDAPPILSPSSTIQGDKQ
ncbi:MAG TPA: nucleotide disphospho-sugar-binding domain-containing protein [Usitatibacter sp.]|nr:nucleotide disphospho-sugar-binding domain-containing protein [Usitatibacter sp.]